MSIASDKELKEAEARFWALAGQAPPPSKLPPSHVAFRNATSAVTQAHIARQEQLRAAQGNAPVAAPPAASLPASNSVADAFFDDTQPGAVNVKRYNR
jgi:hypothetical protein